MSFISLVFGLGGAQTTIGALQLDALLNEETELPSFVSKYAVEDGDEPVTDHITRDSEQLTISGIITASSVTFFGTGGRSKLISAKEALRLVHEQRLPITIVTGMDVYESMGMSGARIGRSGTLEQLTIDCEFQKIRKVVTRTADVPPEKVKPAAKGKAGATAAKAGKADSTTNVPPAKLGQSKLDQLINGKQAAQPAAGPGAITT